jgi:alanyl-tRNA synthetase
LRGAHAGRQARERYLPANCRLERMQVRSGNQIRELFLKFFEEKGHRRVHSSSLVPANDPTLLFTNAGMNQFKDVFLGLENRAYNRATSSQKCVRAGGKHNDLENVGFTRRHHTFFEMLGNFSFGDYFKREAIAYAWELVTSEKWLAMPKDRLYVTIFKGENGVPRDEEAHAFWLEHVPAERIFEMGMADNFWQMGDTGPCGPCSEIFYDMGMGASETPGKDLPFGQDDARYVEIWNLVFMQFDRSAQGELALLPKPSIDTGMGLERTAAVLQNKLSNFETDLFVPLIEKAAKLTHAKGDLLGNPSLRIIADHARAATFLISDGVLPANEGRGYVLRKILRRGIRHGRLLGQNEPFMHEMVFAVRDEMAGAYPELNDSADRVSKIVMSEERQFARVMETGLARLEQDFAPLLAGRNGTAAVTYPGAKAFHLYETYGLPLDFMVDAARDQGLEFDLTGFEAARAEEQARARASWKGGAKSSASPAYREVPKTIFEGYSQLVSTNCEVLAIVRDGAGVPAAAVGEEVDVVLDHTSFYADSGGQVGDHGWLRSDDHNTVLADVLGCVQPVQGVRAHRVRVKQPIALGMKVDTIVDAEFRNATRRNHTGTHLLHAALRQTLGTHVKQAGSLVSPSRLRFDFSHFSSVADEELQDIEDMVNREVLTNTRVETLADVPIDVAVNEYKAMALFGEKYGERVRVVKIGDFSTELCGGIHTGATGEIGLLKLTGESSVSSGVRRVEAVSGMGALDEFRRGYGASQFAAHLTGTSESAPAEALRQRFTAQEDEIKRLRRELDQARMKSAASSVASAADRVVEIKGVKVLSQRVAALDRGQMRTLVDNLRNKLGSGVVVLGSAAEDGKVALIVGVTKDLTGRVQAGKIVGQIAQRVGGSGGGRPDLAEAGGKDATQLDAALAAAPEVVGNLLG